MTICSLLYTAIQKSQQGREGRRVTGKHPPASLLAGPWSSPEAAPHYRTQLFQQRTARKRLDLKAWTSSPTRTLYPGERHTSIPGASSQEPPGRSNIHWKRRGYLRFCLVHTWASPASPGQPPPLHPSLLGHGSWKWTEGVFSSCKETLLYAWKMTKKRHFEIDARTVYTTSTVLPSPTLLGLLF